ncbi:hypothetical protein DES39_0108 [Orbus hercynius]|uniref:Hemolysin n=1 Tax=Orbus hercynius TaxID=593135 RepID=A0A495RHD2_9GAMM|nr:DUF333 domain-containing protein [Orbus hercynius]RKS86902.1 hypothetical protein DES39_0108 [Orbus hercynius]
MKKLLLIASLAFLSAACAKKDTINTPNPASQYCVNIGGKSEIVTDPKGSYGLCHLPDGQVVDEWELFNSNNK